MASTPQGAAKRLLDVGEDRLPGHGEACLACRKVKRKCINSASNAVHSACDRCRALELECVYKQMKRGRKSKAELDSKRTHSPRRSSSRQSSPAIIDSQNDQASEDKAGKPSYARQTTQPPPPTPTSSQACRPVGPTPPFPVTTIPPKASTFSFDRIRMENLPPGQTNPSRVMNGSFAEVFPSSPGASSSARHTVADMQMDPVQSRTLPEEDVQPLFDFYFEKLNPLIAFLDPELHTPTYCRAKSIHLFTAILTVACKSIRPNAYPQCLAVANLFISHAFMQGLSSIELVQSLAILAVWRESDDNNQWRRIGYAIRCALELRLHKPHPRPLPVDQEAARLIVNKERTWIYLTIADHHYAVQQTLPRMISADLVGDPMIWLEDHPTVNCPVETLLAGQLLILRLQELYEALIVEGNKPNSRLLVWLRKYLGNWRSHWVSTETRKKQLLPVQVAFLGFCGKVFQFQLDEFELYLTTIDKANTQSTRANLAFGACIDSSRALLDSLTIDLAPLGCLPYSQDVVWVSLSTTAVWLAQNIAYMSLDDGQAAYESLALACNTCQSASQGPNDMPAYAARLLAHLNQRIRNAPPPTKPTEPPRMTSNPEGGFETLLELQAQLNQNVPMPAATHPSHETGNTFIIPSADDDFWQSYYPALSEFGQQTNDTFWNNAPLSIGGFASTGSSMGPAVDWTVFGQNMNQL